MKLSLKFPLFSFSSSANFEFYTTMLYKNFLSNCPLLTALPSTKASHSSRKIKSSWQKGWLFVVPWRPQAQAFYSILTLWAGWASQSFSGSRWGSGHLPTSLLLKRAKPDTGQGQPKVLWCHVSPISVVFH